MIVSGYFLYRYAKVLYHYINIYLYVYKQYYTIYCLTGAIIDLSCAINKNENKYDQQFSNKEVNVAGLALYSKFL